MNEERVSSAKVVTALKQEAYRRKSRIEDGTNSTSVSSAKTSKPPPPKTTNQPPKTRFCTFCKKEGHTLGNCRRTNRCGVLFRFQVSNMSQGSIIPSGMSQT
jgi:hypothetical protein